MHCHDLSNHINIPKNAKKVVLVGNPNVGKSVVFNALTGLYVDVSNFPGTTLDISYGIVGPYAIIDTPGVYGVSSFNQEEIVARDVILGADIVINVIDAVHLERDLFLTQQIIDMGIPVIVALNMLDEVKKQGIEIDVDLLSDLLGVPVIPTVAVKKEGLDEIKQSIEKARVGHIEPELQRKLTKLLEKVGTQGEALLVLEGDPHVAGRHGIEPEPYREEIYMQRRLRVNDIIQHVSKDVIKGASFATKLGRWMINPLTGIPILLGVMYLMYELVAVFIAQTVVEFTEGMVMGEIYQPFIINLVGRLISEESFIGALLIGEFGILTMTVIYILGLLLPLVLGFYFFLSAMEDSGYLPRVAAMVDRALAFIGLNGRAIIPFILGFGCVTMATITTRLLGSDRERKIAIFLLALAIPCSAQIGVIAVLIGSLGLNYVIGYIAIMFSILVIVGTILNKLFPGESTHLLIDIPPLRIPRVDNVLKKTITKSWHFLKEATPLFAIGALILGILDLTGLLEMIQVALAPLTEGWLKLPREAATAFIMGFVRRDFGAAGLFDLTITPMQTLIASVTISLFVPCIASGMIIIKELNKKLAAIIWISVIILAFLFGGILAQVLI
ncbi:ferrous iron transport protein B [Desulfitibacter alkalitolerans]|uniref:ferrous iron transport protein B n=1 Tax=Desulfitibacter alkalitolerans TaxID=264641 RepID=UPI000483065C|nr:ferrous iron transport protein B [Desulfitibacter alkalitolerans]